MNSLPPPLLATHDVSNQAPPLEDYDLYGRNRPLQEAVQREGAGAAATWLAARGAELGAAEMIALGAAANRNPPAPKLFDSAGRRRDEVEFHPAYHELMGYLKRHGVAAGPWAEPGPGAHIAIPHRGLAQDVGIRLSRSGRTNPSVARGLLAQRFSFTFLDAHAPHTGFSWYRQHLRACRVAAGL